MDVAPSWTREEEIERGINISNSAKAMGVTASDQVENTLHAAASSPPDDLADGGGGGDHYDSFLSSRYKAKDTTRSIIPPPSAFHIMAEQEKEDPDDEDLFGSGTEDNNETPKQESVAPDVKSPNIKEKEEKESDEDDLFGSAPEDDDEPLKAKSAPQPNWIAANGASPSAPEPTAPPQTAAVPPAAAMPQSILRLPKPVPTQTAAPLQFLLSPPSHNRSYHRQGSRVMKVRHTTRKK